LFSSNFSYSLFQELDTPIILVFAFAIPPIIFLRNQRFPALLPPPILFPQVYAKVPIISNRSTDAKSPYPFDQ